MLLNVSTVNSWTRRPGFRVDVQVVSSRWRLPVCFPAACTGVMDQLRVLKCFKVLHLRATQLHHKEKTCQKRKRRRSALTAQRWKTKLSLPQPTAISSLSFNAKLNTYQCWDVPQLQKHFTFCTAGLKNIHPWMIVFPVQYIECSQPKNVATPHQALHNESQLNRSNGNNFIRSSGARGPAAKCMRCQVTIFLLQGERAKYKEFIKEGQQLIHVPPSNHNKNC